jgi:hypothetical protein
VHILGNDFTKNISDPGMLFGVSVTGIRKYGNLTHNGSSFVQRAEEQSGIILDTCNSSDLSGGTQGTLCLCTDCTIADPCTGGGGGALAYRHQAGRWVCR